MKCPKCGANRDHKILHTFRHRSELRVYRIRECKSCKKHWRTFEQTDPRGYHLGKGRLSRRNPRPVGKKPPTVDAELNADERRTGMSTSTAPEDPRDQPTTKTSHEPPPQSRTERQRMKEFAKQVKKSVDKLTS